MTFTVHKEYNDGSDPVVAAGQTFGTTDNVTLLYSETLTATETQFGIRLELGVTGLIDDLEM